MSSAHTGQHDRQHGAGVLRRNARRLAAAKRSGSRPALRNRFPIQFALLGDGTARHRRHAAGPQGSQTCRPGLLRGHVQFAEKLLRRDLRRLRPRDPQTRQRRPELYRIFPASGRRCGLLLARTAVIGLPMYRPLPLRDGAQERHVRHAAFRPAVDRHRRSTGKGAFPAVDPCRLCVQLPMHALPCRTRAAYGSRPRQLRMDIPVPHGRARRTADSARPRTAADPLLRAVGVHLRQNAREYAGLAPFRRLDGRTARGPRTAASGLAGRNTRPNRHDPRQTGKNRGALPLSGTHDPLREYPVGHRRLAADGRRNGLCE